MELATPATPQGATGMLAIFLSSKAKASFALFLNDASLNLMKVGQQLVVLHISGILLWGLVISPRRVRCKEGTLLD
jgi:hypothetical protein